MCIVAAIGEDDQGFAILQIVPCSSCIAVCIEVSGSSLAVYSPVLGICTGIDLNQSTILIQNDSAAPAIGGEGAFKVLVKDDHLIVLGSSSFYSSVVQPLTFCCGKFLAIDGDGYIGNLKLHIQTGNLCADHLVVSCKSSVQLVAVVNGSQHSLAILQGSESLCQIACGSNLAGILHAVRSLCVMVLCGSAVIDTNQSAVLVQNECDAPAVCQQFAGVFLGVDHESQIASLGQFLVVSHTLHVNIELVLANLQNANAISLDFYNAGELGSQGAIGDAQGNGVLTGNIDVEATVAHNGELLDLHIVGCIEGAIVVIGNQASHDSLFQIESGVAQHSQHLVVAGNSGLLINIGGQFSIGVSPVQTDHVTQLMDNALCHEAAAVKVEAFTEGTGLHNDCEATSGNGHSLCEVVSHLHFLAIHDDGSVGAGGICTDGILGIDQLAVGTVAAFDDHAVGVYDGNFTHLTADGNGDSLSGSVVEHAGQGLGGGEVSGQSIILCVLEVHQNAFPLTSGHVVLHNLQSQVGQSLHNNDGTGSGCLLVAQNGFVSNGVGAGDFCIEIAVIGHADAGAGQVGNNAHQDVQVIACIHLYGCGGNSQFQLIALALVVGLGGAGGAGNAGSAVAAVVRIATASGQREGQDQHQCQQHSNDGSCSFHGFLLNFIYHLTYLKS